LPELSSSVVTSVRRHEKRISEILAIVAIVLLSMDTAETFIAQGGDRFLPLTDQQSGILLGISSIILFFLSFGFGYRQKARVNYNIAYSRRCNPCSL
jgi:hypothetical protein